MYHSQVIARSYRLSLAVFVLVIGGTGCSAASEVVRRDFGAGDLSTRTEVLRIDIREIDYEERYVLLRLELENRSSMPVVIERAGLLLAYNGVELSPSTMYGPPTPSSFALEANGSEQIWLSYVTGDRLLRPGRLMLRTVRQSDTYLPLLSLEIPAAPLVQLDGPS